MTLIDAKPSSIRSKSDKAAFGSSKINVIEALVQHQYQGGSGLSSAITTRSLRRGQHLYWPGDLLKYVYSINRGMLKTYRIGDDGNERITGFPTSGKLLGLDTLMDRPMRCGAVALDASLICRIPVHAIVIGSGESRQLRLQLLEQFDNEIARLEIQLSLYCLNAPQRLAGFLLSMADNSAEVHLPMSHKEIGNYLRLVPETVSRLFARFQYCGWLIMRAHGITILDRLGLEQTAAKNIPQSRAKAAAA